MGTASVGRPFGLFHTGSGALGAPLLTTSLPEKEWLIQGLLTFRSKRLCRLLGYVFRGNHAGFAAALVDGAQLHAGHHGRDGVYQESGVPEKGLASRAPPRSSGTRMGQAWSSSSKLWEAAGGSALQRAAMTSLKKLCTGSIRSMTSRTTAMSQGTTSNLKNSRRLELPSRTSAATYC